VTSAASPHPAAAAMITHTRIPKSFLMMSMLFLHCRGRCLYHDTSLRSKFLRQGAYTYGIQRDLAAPPGGGLAPRAHRSHQIRTPREGAPPGHIAKKLTGILMIAITAARQRRRLLPRSPSPASPKTVRVTGGGSSPSRSPPLTAPKRGEELVSVSGSSAIPRGRADRQQFKHLAGFRVNHRYLR
jgi:hypothetical protein